MIPRAGPALSIILVAFCASGCGCGYLLHSPAHVPFHSLIRQPSHRVSNNLYKKLFVISRLVFSPTLQLLRRRTKFVAPRFRACIQLTENSSDERQHYRSQESLNHGLEEEHDHGEEWEDMDEFDAQCPNPSPTACMTSTTI
jgi:hypothetical protein